MSLAQALPLAQPKLISPDSDPAPVDSLIDMGSGKLAQNPESGAIMRVLMQEPGFSTRITDGVRNGHTYNVIHMPGSSNFILRDTWEHEGKRETRYQSFIIRNDSAQESRESAAPSNQPPDMISELFDDIERSLDEFLALNPLTAPHPSSL